MANENVCRNIFVSTSQFAAGAYQASVLIDLQAAGGSGTALFRALQVGWVCMQQAAAGGILTQFQELRVERV